VRILYLCHRFPYPPKRGGKIRPFNMIRHLSASHDVTVASLVRSDVEADEAKGIAPFCAEYHVGRVRNWVQGARMVARLPTTIPSSMGYFYSAALDATVRSLLRERRFDLIFVHCSSVAQYVVHVRDIPKILDFGDMDSQKWLEYSRYKPFPLSLGYWLEGAKLEAEERRLAGRFDHCTATTRAEWETLRRYGVETSTDWFPNGVDSEFFAPSEEAYDPDTICFVGRMDYYPNQECMFEFCARTWPLLRAQRPRLRLLIVGADPSPRVRALGEIPGVVVTGSVPDVRPYVHRSALMVAPLNIARGTQNKLLESMAMAVPVVTSPVAAGGVDALAGEHFLTARSPEEYRDAIQRVLDHPAERRRFAEAGRARMLSHHAWPNSMKRLDAIISRCVDNFSLRAAKEQLAS
jgi:sugar transferase (PEP-CTERM/EpsH1 system associated)